MFDEHLVYGDRTTEPRMPWITDFSRLSIMGVGLSTCIIANGIIRGIGNWLIVPEPQGPRDTAVCYRTRLGGLLRYYYRAA
jgi:hypothetical protein